MASNPQGKDTDNIIRPSDCSVRHLVEQVHHPTFGILNETLCLKKSHTSSRRMLPSTAVQLRGARNIVQFMHRLVPLPMR